MSNVNVMVCYCNGVLLHVLNVMVCCYMCTVMVCCYMCQCNGVLLHVSM